MYSNFLPVTCRYRNTWNGGGRGLGGGGGGGKEREREREREVVNKIKSFAQKVLPKNVFFQKFYLYAIITFKFNKMFHHFRITNHPPTHGCQIYCQTNHTICFINWRFQVKPVGMKPGIVGGASGSCSRYRWK